MATTAMDMVRTSTLSLSAIFISLPLISHAGEWEFTPKLIVEEAYSDNVELVNIDEKTSLVSQLGVAINSAYKAQYLNFDFNSQSTYAMFSHDHELDDDFHTANAQARYMLWPNGITLIASAGVSNQSRNAARNGLADIVNGNTTQVENYSTGIAYDVSNSDFTINSSLQYQTRNAEDNIGEREGITAAVSFNNSTNARNVFWAINGNYQDLNNRNIDRKFYRNEIKLGWISGVGLNPFIRHYIEDNEGALIANQQSLESDSIGLGVRWLVTPRLSLDLSYNKPNEDDAITIDGETQDNYLDASIDWQPSRRTRIQASFSQRFYGDSYQLSLSHQNRRLSNSISYNEGVRAFTRNNYVPVEQGVFVCPQEEIASLNQCYLNEGQAIDVGNSQLIPIFDYELVEDYGLSLNKTLSWSSTLTLPRTTFSLNANSNLREGLEANSLDNERKSAGFVIKRNLGEHSAVSFSATYTEQTFESLTQAKRDNTYRQYAIDYNTKLSNELSAVISLKSLNRASEQVFYNYDENRLTVTLSKGF